MLSFYNRPSTSLYNSLPAVEEADRRLSEIGRGAVITKLGSVIIRHRLEHTIGIRLLHKHNDVDRSEIMLETEELDGAGIPCLVTMATKLPTDSTFIANSWRFSGAKFDAVEFSSDSVVKHAHNAINTGDVFIAELAEVIQELGAQDIIGPCIAVRSFYDKPHLEENDLLIETTDTRRRANIVRYDNSKRFKPSNLLHTSWTFKRGVDLETGSEVTLGCVKENCVTHTACVVSGGEHSEESHHSSQHRQT